MVGDFGMGKAGQMVVDELPFLRIEMAEEGVYQLHLPVVGGFLPGGGLQRLRVHDMVPPMSEMVDESGAHHMLQPAVDLPRAAGGVEAVEPEPDMLQHLLHQRASLETAVAVENTEVLYLLLMVVEQSQVAIVCVCRPLRHGVKKTSPSIYTKRNFWAKVDMKCKFFFVTMVGG